MYKPPLFLLLLCLCASASYAQSAWKLATQEDGIKVYIIDVKESKIKALKVECELFSGVDPVVALLIDIPATEKWMLHIKTCSTIRKVTDTDLYTYTEVSLPWPMANRDFVTHLRVTQNAHSKLVTVESPVVPTEMAEKSGVVRIVQSKSTWLISPVAPNRVKLEYYLFVDPGGMIPAWLVNYFATGASIDTIKNMRAILQTPKYKQADLPFIVN